MSTRNITMAIAVQGESQYRQAITAINSDLKTMQSALALATALFADNANSEAALTAKSNALQAVLSQQAAKLDTMRAALINAQQAQAQWSARLEEARGKSEASKQALSQLDAATIASGNAWNSHSQALAAAQRKMDDMRAAGTLTEETERDLTAEITRHQAALDQLAAETNGAAKAAGELLNENERQTAAMKEAEAGYNQAHSAVNRWTQQVNAAEAQTIKMQRELDQTNEYLDEAKSSADGCATSIDKFGKSTRSAASDLDAGNSSLESTTESLKSVEAVFAAGKIVDGLKKTAAAMGECVTKSSEFGASMSTVEALSGASEEALAALSNQAKATASSTQFTAAEVAQAYQYMGMAGWDSAQMLAGLSGVMNLTAASGEDLGTTTDIVTDALSAFGLTADDTTRFTDVLAATATSTNTSVGIMGETFKNCASVAGALGYSVEDVAVGIGLMANSGIKGSKAGTALKNTFNGMLEGAKLTAKAFGEYEFSAVNADGSVKEFSASCDELRSVFGQMTDAEKVQNAQLLAGKEGYNGLLAILNATDEDYQKVIESINNSTGAAERMAAIRLDNFAGQVTLAQSAAEALQIAVGEQLEPALGKLVTTVTGALGFLTDFVADNKAVVPILAGVTVGLGAMVVGLTAATAGVQLFTAASAALSAVAAPVIPLMAGAAVGAGVLTAAFAAVSGVTDEVSESYKSTMAEISASAGNWETTSAQLETNANKTDALMASLQGLMEVEDKDIATKKQISSLVDELNAAVPELNLAYDEQTDSLNMSTEAMEAYVDQMAAQAEQQAILDRLVELRQEEYDLNQSISDQYERMADVRIADGAAAMSQATGLAKMQSQTDDLTAAQAANKSEQERLTAQLETLTAQTDATTGATGTLADATSSLADTTESVTIRSVEDLQNLYDGYESTAAEANASISSQIGRWNDLVETADYSMQELLQNMADYLQQQKDYGSNLAIIADKYGDDIAAMLADGSAASVQQAAIMATATDDEVASYKESYTAARGWQSNLQQSYYAAGESAVNAKNKIKTQMDSAVQTSNRYSDFYSAGGYAMTGLADGVKGSQSIMMRAFDTAASLGLSTFFRRVGQGSPWRSMRQSGRWAVEGLAIGITDNLGMVRSAAGNMADAALSQMDLSGVSAPAMSYVYSAQTGSGYDMDADQPTAVPQEVVWRLESDAGQVIASATATGVDALNGTAARLERRGVAH